jgi:hypothetical protein
MPILARLRLGSIGAPGARFDPLDIELVGEDRRLRHTLLFLRNGGGKSSLIALTLLLLNPKVGLTLGRTQKGDPKRETDYVRRGEAGVVLAEWIPDRPTAGRPRSLVTFMAMQRGEREDAAEKGFVAAMLPAEVDPVAVFELRQCLPREARGGAGAAHGVEGLLRRAREVAKEHRDWEVAAIPGHEPKRWLKQLADFGLEPALAQLLARMNLEEGDLAKALTFSSAEEFVTHAARLLAPPEDVVRNLHAAIEKWKLEYRDQGAKRLTRAEIERVRPLWEALVERVAARERAFGRLRDHAEDTYQLVRGVKDALPNVEAAWRAAREESERAEAAREAARTAAERLEGEEAALALASARRLAEERGRAAEEAEESARAAALAARVASARVPAIRLAAAEALLQALREKLASREADAGVAAQLARRDALALGLAALEAERAASLGARLAALDRAERAACEGWGRHDAALSDALGREGRAREAVEARRRALAEARRALEALAKEGRLEPGEDLAQAHGRASARAGSLRRNLDELRTSDARRRAERDAARARGEALDRELGALAKQRRAIEGDLERARRACAEMQERLTAAGLDLGAVSLPSDGERAAEAASRAYRAAVTSRTESAARLAALEEACRSLSERDVLPASHDVRRVTEAAGPGFRPALEYVSENLRERAGEVLRAVPGLAHAVVAASTAALERAGDALAAVELEVDSPVPVYVGADLAPESLERARAHPAASARGIVGIEPHLSREARDRLLASRTEARERVRRLLADVEARAVSLERLHRDLASCLARHGTERQSALESALIEVDAKVRAAAQERAAVEATLRTLGAEVEAGEREVATTEGELARAEAGERALARAAGAHGEVLRGGEAALRALEETLARESAEAAAAKKARGEAEALERRAAEEKRAVAAEQHAARDSERRFRLAASRSDVPAAPVEGAGREAAAAEFEALHGELEGGERALRAEVERAARDAERARRDLLGEAGAPDLASRVRAELPPGLGDEEATLARERAREEERRANGASGAARQAARDAEAGAATAARALERLEGAARAAAEAFRPPEGDGAALAALLADLAARRRAAAEAIAAAERSVRAAAQAEGAGKALLGRWQRLVEAAEDAWEALRGQDIGPDVERAILAIVTPDRNGRVVPDPAALVERIEKETKAMRKEAVARRGLLERAHADMLAEADKASAIASRSPSAWVRDASTLRGFGGAGAPEADARARLEALAGRARRDLEALLAEAENLDAQLADLVKTQAAIALQLGEQTRRLAGRILDLERASTLPAGLAAWSGKQFLSIELPLPEDEGELARTLERGLAAWAEADRAPAARDLLPEALAHALSAPPRVLIPKADRFDVWSARRPIQQLSKDSGGEALTAAFILYCVMARVAAGGRRGDERVTLALIDNPLGTANKFDFVDAQCRVAAAFSVQYIAASGIPDPRAIERFERLVTLTNPTQSRVRRASVEDQDLGRPIEGALLARDDVLVAPGAPPRFGAPGGPG